MTLTLLSLVGCTDLWFELPPKDGGDTAVPDTDADADTDTDADTDSDTDSDTDTDTDSDTDLPATCAPAAWAWHATNTVLHAEASFVGTDDDDAAGAWIVNAGDMDGDGLDDLVAATPYANVGGAAYFVIGGITRGLGQPLDGFPSLLGEPDAYFGNVAPLGDIDGDGLADVAMGPGQTVALGAPAQWLLKGRTSGWPFHGDLAVDTDARLTNTSNDGVTDVSSLASFGDLDGDGLNDWVLFGPAIERGELHALHGDDAVGDVTIPTADTTWVYGGTEQLRVYNYADLDGDGRTDLVASSPVTGEGYVLLAATVSGLHGERIADVADATAPGGYTLRDLDGDGDDELATAQIVGVPDADRGVYFFMGVSSWSGTLTLADADVRVGAGDPVHTPTWLGDLDGDGLPELGVLHSISTDARTYATEVYIYLGRTTWPSALTLAEADVHISAESPFSEVLRLPEPSMLGDIDGDGFNDLVIRMEEEDVDGVDASGRVVVFRGRASWPSEVTVADADAKFVGEVTYQRMGAELLVMDVDGDGCDDVVTRSIVHPVGSAKGEVFVHFGQSYGPS